MLEPGIYWVWWQNRWVQGEWDGEDWELGFTCFGFEIPVGPKWTVPPKPVGPPVAKES